MKLLMAVSIDGFVAKGPVDDMSWTGSVDKAIFKLLTMTGDRELYAGYTTCCQLPALKNRKVRPLSRDTMKGYKLQDIYQYDSWLIGGQTVALEAIDKGYLKEVYLCHLPNILLKDGIPLDDKIRKFGIQLDKISIDSKVLVEIRKK